MKVHLTEDKLWRGQVYLRGDRDIPEELAIALNLGQKAGGVETESESESESLPQPLTPNPQPLISNPQTSKPKRRRSNA